MVMEASLGGLATGAATRRRAGERWVIPYRPCVLRPGVRPAPVTTVCSAHAQSHSTSVAIQQRVATRPGRLFDVPAVLPPLIAFGASALLVRLLLLPTLQRWLLDLPNYRSLHAQPIPRTGGLGMMLGLALGLVMSGVPSFVLLLTMLLMSLSLLDDWRGLPPAARLVAHLGAALTFVLGSGVYEEPLAMLALVLAIAWVTNLYNFMDGADGLAGGMALFGFSAYAVASWYAGEPALALASLSVAAAACAFLLFNFPPARVFMGDAGSIPLGFLAAVFGVSGWQAGVWPLWFPLAVFAPFVLDATVTLVRRALRGEKLWQPHRSHYYQRQILLGCSHRRLAMSEYALMALSAGAALIALRLAPSAQVAILTLLAAVHLGLGLNVDLRWRNQREKA